MLVKTTVLSHLAHPLFNMTRFEITRIPFAHIDSVKTGFGIPLVKVDARIGFGIRWSKLMLGRVALDSMDHNECKEDQLKPFIGQS